MKNDRKTTVATWDKMDLIEACSFFFKTHYTEIFIHTVKLICPRASVSVWFSF